MPSLYIRNDGTVWLRGLKNPKTDAYINTATPTWELRSAKYPDGTVVASGNATYLTGSDGDYEINIDDATDIVAGTKYVIRVIAVVAGVGTLDVEDFIVARGRTGRTSTT